MANPMTKPMALAALKTRSRKSFERDDGLRRHPLGQEERHRQHDAEDRSDDAREETQAHEIPPRLAKMMSDVAEPASEQRPRVVDACETRRRWPGSTAPVTKRARIPSGRLM